MNTAEIDEQEIYENEGEYDLAAQDFDENYNQNLNEKSPEENDGPKEISMEEARNKIRIVFKYYASFGNRLNMSYIQGSKVVKMMKDSNVISKSGVSK